MDIKQNQTEVRDNQNPNEQGTSAPTGSQAQSQATTSQDQSQRIKDLEARLTDLNNKYNELRNNPVNNVDYKYPTVTDTSKLPDYIKRLKTEWGLK